MSEISAMISSFVASTIILVHNNRATAEAQIPAHIALIGTVVFTTLVWGVVTLMTAPTPRDTLASFYRLVRPAGPGWRRLRESEGLEPSRDSIAHSLLCWVLGCTTVYAALFGAGAFLFGRFAQGWVLGAAFALSTGALIWLVSRSWGRAKTA